MSNIKHSACIPPPSDYTPKTRNNRPNTSFDRRHNPRDRPRSGPSSSFRSESQDDPEPQPDRLKNQPKDKFFRTDDEDYFARIQDDDDQAPTEQEPESTNDDDEDDPLDAYMKSLEESECQNQTLEEAVPSDREVSLATTTTTSARESETQPEIGKKRGVRLDIDGNDDFQEAYYKRLEQSKAERSDSQDEERYDEKMSMVEYDKDGNVISVKKVKRDVDPLPPLDHSTITYEPFQKNFYSEHDEINRMTKEQETELRSKLEIKVSGNQPPKPVCSFAHFKFDEQLMRVIRRSEYTQPTPIQAQAIPAALLGRNIIGVAMTGSGKTAAYLWPMIVHIMGQPDLKRGDGPIGLILVPTRELALQVYSQAKKFSTSYNIAVVCAYGGGSKYEQSRDLEAGAEVVVATPGRLIDLIKAGATNLRRVTYFVLDEADRFFEMGFELQVRSICDHIRPDRQTLLFSATFKPKTEQLARTVTEDPIKIVQRALGEANEDVTQHVIVLKEASEKWNWLMSNLVKFTSTGGVLIFVTRIVNSEELHKNLVEHGSDALLLNGDLEQSERNRVITAFKKKEKDIMIATDVAARGLDITHIKTVINFDVARDIDTHVHRIGRTGRAGTKGDAYTLITEKDKDFAGKLVKSLESSNQEVSDNLMRLAMQSHSFRKSRSRDKHYSKRNDNHRRDDHHHSREDKSYRYNHRTHDETHHGNRHAGGSHNQPPEDRKKARWN